jgi:hypothetical protein
VQPSLCDAILLPSSFLVGKSSSKGIIFIYKMIECLNQQTNKWQQKNKWQKYKQQSKHTMINGSSCSLDAWMRRAQVSYAHSTMNLLLSFLTLVNSKSAITTWCFIAFWKVRMSRNRAPTRKSGFLGSCAICTA